MTDKRTGPMNARTALAKRTTVPASWNKPRGVLSKKQEEAALREVAVGRGHVYSYHIVLRPEPEGGYTVLVPSLPGCITYGKSLDDARVMAEDAIRAYLLSMEKHNDADPVSDGRSLISLVDVPLYR